MRRAERERKRLRQKGKRRRSGVSGSLRKSVSSSSVSKKRGDRKSWRRKDSKKGKNSGKKI